MTYTVELLEEKDLIWSVEVACRRMINEELKRPELFNREQLYNIVLKIIQDGTGIIAKVDGEPVGGIAGLLVPNTFNPEITTLAEFIWYILPEHRGSRAAAMAFNKYIEMAKTCCDEATLSLLPDSNVNLKSLEKRGFKHEELAFRLNFKEK